MFIKIAITVAILEILFGTIFAVLSIIKMTIKELLMIGTWGWIEDQAKGTITQQLQARIGITFILTGSIIQIVTIWLEKLTLNWFCILIVSTSFVDIIVIIVSIMIYKRNMKAHEEKIKK